MRTVLVTGSASGLGAAIRTRLEAEGSRVLGADLTGQEIDADLSTVAGRAELAAAAESAADGSLDGVVACAGVGSHVPQHAIVSVNYFGAVATLEGLFPLLRKGSAPAAVAISSNSIGMVEIDDELIASFEADDEERARARAPEVEGAFVYGTTKLGIARWVRRQAQEWGEAGVRLNAVAPGATKTPMLEATAAHEEYGPALEMLPIPIGRHGEPEEIAAVVNFLLSTEASLVHGSVWFADGGSDALFRPELA